MKKLNFSLIALFLLILIGGGCEKTTTNNQNEENTNSKSAFENIVDDTKQDTKALNGIEARAEVNTDGTVDVYWTVNEEISKKAASYRLIYDKTENPIHPGYMWFERGKSYRDKYWTGLPAGKGYIRVCVVENTKCIEYSNNVEVDIPENETNNIKITTTTESITNKETDMIIEENQIEEQNNEIIIDITATTTQE